MLKCVDIQRAQQMEYHFAHIIDKPFEAQFKFIHVLPGAFSAYRTDALYKKRIITENGEVGYV
jgi:cellulose synthase/poly-beta-1,6-N-acetylglucosamine synthase-like glycosyltransferase